MEDITDAVYMHANRVCKDFQVKKLGKYHDLYLKSDTWLLADVFESFREMCLKIHLLDPAKKFSFWISMASRFRKDWRKIEVMCHTIQQIKNLHILNTEM